MVYPRTHGETYSKSRVMLFVRGLSPYTRGNLGSIANSANQLRSIPVHTGKPFQRQTCPMIRKVYPRTHGETSYTRKRKKTERGLSPYTRGNLLRRTAQYRRLGSIPVHTGKPISPNIFLIVSRVYPRTHGETQIKLRRDCPSQGLSPYTRGNPPADTRMPCCSGSIPVHTGKPVNVVGGLIVKKVYPRTHGETSAQQARGRAEVGLSPYTRGNQKEGERQGSNSRSIPVHTGKPVVVYAAPGSIRVYPRTHGETEARYRFTRPHRGLSPYTRGNHCSLSNVFTLKGSIPVHTGKPVCDFLTRGK